MGVFVARLWGGWCRRTVPVISHTIIPGRAKCSPMVARVVGTLVVQQPVAEGETAHLCVSVRTVRALGSN